MKSIKQTVPTQITLQIKIYMQTVFWLGYRFQRDSRQPFNWSSSVVWFRPPFTVDLRFNPESRCKLMRAAPKANFKHQAAAKTFFVNSFSSHPKVRKELHIDLSSRKTPLWIFQDAQKALSFNIKSLQAHLKSLNLCCFTIFSSYFFYYLLFLINVNRRWIM